MRRRARRSGRLTSQLSVVSRPAGSAVQPHNAGSRVVNPSGSGSNSTSAVSWPLIRPTRVKSSRRNLDEFGPYVGLGLATLPSTDTRLRDHARRKVTSQLLLYRNHPRIKKTMRPAPPIRCGHIVWQPPADANYANPAASRPSPIFAMAVRQAAAGRRRPSRRRSLRRSVGGSALGCSTPELW